MKRRGWVSMVAVSLTLLGPSAAPAGQDLATVSWRLAPFCNVVTLTVVLEGPGASLSGFDDNCGGAHSAAYGAASVNPDGAISLGFTVVAPTGPPEHFEVVLTAASAFSGTWRDASGASGDFIINPSAPTTGTPRPAPAVRPVAGGQLSTAAGIGALRNNAGNFNTAVGNGALHDNTTGESNVGVGSSALTSNNGNSNTAVGDAALNINSAGSNNTAVGASALVTNAIGSQNTAVGVEALVNNSSGSRNIALGISAGSSLTTEHDNIAIGHDGTAGVNGAIRIGTAGTQTSAFVAGISGVNVGAQPAVLVSSTGQLGVNLSSARFKQDIAPVDDASRGLRRLRPVMFRYRQASSDGSRPLQYGLIAEETAEVFPELVAHDGEGRPSTVLYHVLPVLLLNELQRQERELAALRATVETLQRQLHEALPTR